MARRQVAQPDSIHFGLLRTIQHHRILQRLFEALQASQYNKESVYTVQCLPMKQPGCTILLLAGPASGFFVGKTTVSPFIASHARCSRCWAKKARSTGKRKASGKTSGFGAKTTTAPVIKVNDDYSIFPRLEPDVLDTLVPTCPELGAGPASEAAPEALPDEIYQRLEQIYGFPDFNYVGSTKSKGKDSMSLTDMLSSSTEASSSSSNKNSLDALLGTSSSSSAAAPSMGSADLDALLASATGGAAPSMEVSTTTSTTEKDDSLNLQHALDKIPSFSGVRVLHIDPLVLNIDNFFTSEECDHYIEMSLSASNRKRGDVMESRSPTVGKDAAAKAQRTSTTWYHHYKNVPEFIAKASRLLGLDTIERWEEPQTVRYRRNEKFTWHLDALGPAENQLAKGGQRIVTFLIYLTDLTARDGGATVFRDLGGISNAGDDPSFLKVQPKKGSALVFFPSAGGIPNTPLDIRTLHCGEVVAESSHQDKWISQLWLRERSYTPTAPAGNKHSEALQVIDDYCSSFEKSN